MLDKKNTDTIHLEFTDYLKVNFPRNKLKKDLESWKKDHSLFWCRNKVQFPLVSRVWRRIGTIKASSSSTERVFSLGGLILSARRLNMNQKTL